MLKIKSIVITVIIGCSVFALNKLYASGQYYGILDSAIEIHGIIAQEYYNYEKDGDNTGASSFNNHYAYLFVNSMFQKNVSGLIEIKMHYGGRDIGLERCLIDWKLKKQFSVKVGKFYHDILFNINQVRPVDNNLVTPNEISEMVMLRDVGLEVYGEYPLSGMKIGYELAVTNGAIIREININTDTGRFYSENIGQDTDRKKAIMGALSIWPVEKLKIFSSYYNTKSDQVLSVRTTEPSGVPGFDIVTLLRTEIGDINLEMVSAYIQLNLKKMELFLGSSSAEEKQQDGSRVLLFNNYNGQLVYNVTRKKYVNYMDLVFKYSRVIYIPAGVFSSVPDSRENNYHLGVNISPYENFILKAEYRWVDEVEGVELKNNGFLLQAVIDF